MRPERYNENSRFYKAGHFDGFDTKKGNGMTGRKLYKHIYRGFIAVALVITVIFLFVLHKQLRVYEKQV